MRDRRVALRTTTWAASCPSRVPASFPERSSGEQTCDSLGEMRQPPARDLAHSRCSSKQSRMPRDPIQRRGVLVMHFALERAIPPRIVPRSGDSSPKGGTGNIRQILMQTAVTSPAIKLVCECRTADVFDDESEQDEVQVAVQRRVFGARIPTAHQRSLPGRRHGR